MEVFIRNIHPEVAEPELKSFLGSLLALDTIQTFDVRMTKAKGFAVLTIADTAKVQLLLTRYERDQRTAGFHLRGKPIRLSYSRKTPNPWLVGVLQKEEKDRLIRLQSREKGKRKPLDTPLTRHTPPNLNFWGLSCGRWEARQSNLFYVIFGTYDASGVVMVDRKSLSLTLDCKDSCTKFEVVMNFDDIHSIEVKPVARSTDVTITLGIAPKIYELIDSSANNHYESLSLAGQIRKPPKQRITGLGPFS